MSETLRRVTGERRGAQGGGHAPLIVAAVIIVVWSVLHGPSVDGGSLAYRFGGALGAGLVQAALTFGILCLVMLRRMPPGRAPTYFVVLLGIAVFANLLVEVGGSAARREADVARTEMAGAARDILAGKTDIDTTPKAAGSAGQMEAWGKTFWRTLADDQKRYQAEVAALKLDTVFQPASLRSDPKFVEARRKVAAAQALVSQYEALSQRRIEAARADIQKLDISEAERRELLAGFDQGRGRGEGALKRMWVLEHGIVDAFSGMVETAAKANGHWAIEAGQIAFERDADLATFNGHAKQLNRLIAEQETLQKAQRARLQHQAKAFEAGAE